MERMRDLLSFFFAAMAMVSLLCAVYQAFNDHKASALTLGGLFIASALMFDLPRIVSISAWGVSAQLQSTLDNAKDVIERLKKLAEANAAVTYMTLAWGNRMGTPSAVDKQKLLDDTDAQLRALNVGEAQRLEIAKPLIDLIGVDLYSAYSRVMYRLVFWLSNAEDRRFQADQSPQSAEQHRAFAAKVADWQKANAGQTPYRDRQDYDLDAYLQRDIPTELLSDAQRAKAQALREQVLALYEGCKRKGGYTPEAADFLDKQGGEDVLGAADRKVAELFGVSTQSP
jgi:hypothetical protein